MKKLKVIFIAVFILILCPAVFAAAEASGSVTVSCIRGTVTVSGSASLKSGELITVMVLNPGVEIGSVSISSISPEQVYTIKQFAAEDDSGVFSISFDMSGSAAEGEYKVCVGFEKSLSPEYASFEYINEETLRIFLENVNSLNASELVDVLSDEVNQKMLGSLGVKTEIYGLITERADKAAVCERLLSNKPAEGFDRDNISRIVNEACEFMLVKTASSVERVELIISKYSDILDLDPAFKEIFNGLDKTEKAFVYEVIRRNTSGYTDIAEFKEDYNFGVAASMVYTTYYKELLSVLSEYNTVFKLELSKLDGLGADILNNIFLQTAGNRYYSQTELERAFETAAESALNNSTPVKPSVPGGSGSSGGSGSVGKTPLIPSSNQAAVPDSKDDAKKEGFSDIDNTHWAYDSVMFLSCKGIINGYENGSFMPDKTITRSEFVKIVISAYGLLDMSARTDFSDVTESDWQFPYIASAYEKGLVGGIGNGVFGADNYITREDAVVILHRVLKYIGVKFEYEPAVDFTDGASVSPYARDAVAALKGMNLINGFEDGTFLPEKPITRAESSGMLYEALQLKAN